MNVDRGPILPALAQADRLPLGPFFARLSDQGFVWLVLESGPYPAAPVWRHLATLPLGPGLADELRALADAVEAAGAPGGAA